MSREKLAVTKRAAEAYNARDLRNYDALFTPDFEWVTAMAGIENEVLRGRDGVERYFADLDAAWEYTRVFGGEFRDLDDRVLWLGQMEARGRGSGTLVRSPAASLYEFGDAKISRLRSFLDHDEALGAAELVESAMSENVDLVRSIYTAWERGDYGSISWADADLEVVSADGPEPGSWKGLAAVAERWRAYLSAWENLRAEAEEYREIDRERVLVLARNRGVGRTSGLDLARIGDSANVFHIRAGRVCKLILYWDRERALADLEIEQ